MGEGKQNKVINRYLLKTEMLLLKLLPAIIAICYLCSSILLYFGKNTMLFMYTSGMSLLPIIFMYISSHAFNFCPCHRVFLHYIVINNCVKIIGHEQWFAIDKLTILIIHIITAILTAIIFIILYVKNNKSTSTEDS